jgi:class 3 adenylate cyclase
VPIAPPKTRYARSGDLHIAFQVFGEGDIDVVLVNGYISHVELVWEAPQAANFFEALGSFARVITFDRRGSGLSDPVAEAPTLEERMDDVRAVMDAAGSERAALVGISEGAAMSILFAATHPERVQALVSWGGMARATEAEDYPWATPAAALVESGLEFVMPYWGDGSVIEIAAPSMADNADARAFLGRMERATASPGMLTALAQMFLEIDVRDVVPTVQVPTLVLHRRHDRLVNVRNGRWLAEHLPNGRLVELPGDDHTPWSQGVDRIVDEIQEFLTGTHYEPELERVLSTVAFTDIVDSTKTASELGDTRWRDVLTRHGQAVASAVERHGGRQVKSTGDGFLLTFDGPARGIRCAQAIVDSAASLGIKVRAGLHTGECELIGDDVGGIAVHIAARVSDLAAGDEVLVSRTVRDLVAGSGIEFEARGTETLKGVPDTWEIYAAVG